MIRICSQCQKLNMPCVIGEKPPYLDTRLSHGLCLVHYEAFKVLITCEHREQEERLLWGDGSSSSSWQDPS